ncbi:hypothetical protein [Peloplasma aerotolerans]|uniref:Uncharacterized protein n=1 Tax=Peloplasma aerotolerans TaxID=3044389 RepID=A0AAW6U8M2_9MOLU|nr:hypothetical protein [Mariniplasma sp. M4Ah]MDI6452396.1 hypothetical protein [Mariniplasma sp. M4Ah]
MTYREYYDLVFIKTKNECNLSRKKSSVFDLLDVTVAKISTVLSVDFHRNRQLLNTPQGNAECGNILTYQQLYDLVSIKTKSDYHFPRKKSPLFDLLDVTVAKISTVLSADFHRNRQLLNIPESIDSRRLNLFK